MDPAARNLRCFYGVNAVKVWSRYRDFQRAERSIAVYEKVMEQLRQDLKLEAGRRGTLVRLRSNEVTEVKDKLGSVEEEKNSILKQKREKESTIDTFIGRMEVRLKALLGSSDGVEKIKEDIDKNQKKSQKLENQIKGISKELADAVFRQNAAIDPIEDLEFALEYLESEIDNCHERQAECRDFINGLTTIKCMEGGPLILDLLIHSGLELEDHKNFADLYIKIHEEAHGICSMPVTRDGVEVDDCIESVSNAFESDNIEMKGNVKLTGVGTHHRKVRRGKSRVWREFTVNFNGTTSVKIDFDQQKYRPEVIQQSLRSHAIHNFNGGRNENLENVDSNKKSRMNLLRQYSSMLFEQLILI